MARYLLVLDRKNVIGHLDHGHRHADRSVKTGEFNAYRAGTDNQHAGWKLRRHQGFAIGPDALSVRNECGTYLVAPWP